VDRKYFKTPIDELEALVKENLNHRQVLGEVRDELTFRTNKRAKQLLKEVEGILAGEVRVPKPPPPPDTPENQLDMLGGRKD